MTKPLTKIEIKTENIDFFKYYIIILIAKKEKDEIWNSCENIIV